MDSHARGRSPSGPTNHIRHSTSASPHPPLDPSFAATVDNHLRPSLNSNPSSSSSFTGFSARAASGAFGDPSFTQDFSQQAKWSLDPTYQDFPQQEQQQRQGQQHQQPPPLLSHDSSLSQHTFLQSATIGSQHPHGQPGQGSNHVSPGALSQTTSPYASPNPESSAFPSFDFSQTSFDQHGFDSVDPTLLDTFDPNSLDLLSPQQDNPGGTLDPMAATLSSHSPTPPHLLPDMGQQQSGGPSPHASPSFQQVNFQNFTRPRNLSESLDPSSAMFPQHGQPNEWTNMGAYRSHRRTPSDNYSEYSSHSNQNSPYMGNIDSFDPNAHSSPMLDPSQDPTFNSDLGLTGFSLNENQVQHQSNYISPGHSPHHSPHLAAQQTLPPFTADNHYGLNVNMTGQFPQQQNGGLDMFPPNEPFPAMGHASPAEGAADQMSPPEINIDYAPPTKVENLRPGHAEDTLSPPVRQPKARTRAKSDSYAGSRPSSPGLSGRGRSPSLQPQHSSISDTLAPLDHRPTSRSPSPARGRNGSLGNRARSSSGASDQRDYILDLANPERAPSSDNSKRVQKHPATFHCTLCTKRFTRAYNLRSHLRTHTDERPFVCTVCGKAFARQHDRKRHEGLHSGEKKFVCKGNLQSGAQWGCNRRFARADALGRHFRSEAGRVCIKPLLDEEAAERQRAWMAEQQQAQLTAGLVAPQPMMNNSQMDIGNSFLPAVLLQQYPALANIDWNAIPAQGGGGGMEEDYSGRSSFDASSGGEFSNYEDLSESEIGHFNSHNQSNQNRNHNNDPNMTGMNSMSSMSMGGHQLGLAQPSPGGAQAFGGPYGGTQSGDYLGDFEGR
ncbi:hypothetical protein B0A50_05733 [Salinomyces thailandicus]|uniref:C2H2-type domain-containing protein n=1 Tax=Salinomyces thailandicus TaxID=706561 RepID=A0A4U0TSH6_9PEZI|nr:hypothetical protein B0A50_05733 [Salinomyces thailandica]